MPPIEGSPSAQPQPAYVIPFVSTAIRREAKMRKLRSMVVWRQKEPRDLAAAWAFTSGGQTRTVWLHTSAHRPPAAVRWLMLAYPPPCCCFFPLVFFHVSFWYGTSYWGFPFTVHFMKQATELKPGQVMSGACCSGLVSHGLGKTSSVPFHLLSPQSLCHHWFL